MTEPLLLASASPRRREMLERIGLSIEVHPADVDETPHDGEPPAAYVARVARAKAIAITRKTRHWVLAADTTVSLEGTILGKAESGEEAAKMLRWLSGKTHQVLTAFVLIGERNDGTIVRTIVREGLVTTDVSFQELDAAMLADYVASGEWRGKAGAYAIQGIGAVLVREVRGSVTNVAGLPLAEVVAALREVGAPLPRLVAGNPA
ncbi:MAG: nucleoside triphosphate pyrophosphatase [Kofleriaceae bacterium]